MFSFSNDLLAVNPQRYFMTVQISFKAAPISGCACCPETSLSHEHAQRKPQSCLV